MRITFANETAARAAVKIIERYGYEASAHGRVVWTDCPPLLAVPAVGRDLGLQQMQEVNLEASHLRRDGAPEAPSLAV
jgi:hypothetical protein